MKHWKYKLLITFVTSGTSAYLHNLAWAVFASQKDMVWADWATRVSTWSTIVASCAGVAALFAFFDDRIENAP